MHGYYYNDLTYYSIGYCENALNVGFAVNANETVEAKTQLSGRFLDKLSLFLDDKNVVNKIRNSNGNDDWFEFGTQWICLNKAQIRIISSNTTNTTKRYAAPDSIIKYIYNGNYTPPDEFVEAVLNGPPPHSLEYQQYISRFNQDFLWGEDDEYISRSKELSQYIDASDERRLGLAFANKLADINMLTKYGSLLNMAIKRRNSRIAEFLIVTGIDIDKFNGVELLTAISYNDLKIAELLLNNNIYYNQKAKYCDPVFYAMHYKNSDALGLLEKHNIFPVANYLR